WQMLEALLTLLPLTVAQLQLAFAERSQVDYAEVAVRALAALGTAERPTDLALALDYRIRHLLVDEFQDTSINQFTLLERLTAGWENGDGRTLFLVGDPMQSIYRFREAQVGLFLRAQQHGIGTLRLTPLTLSVNFRSQQGVVDWVNAAFSGLFPSQADASSGAVPYSPSSAQHAVLAGTAVQVHPFYSRNLEPEAEQILTLIREAQTEKLQTAILVRSRKHLGALVPRLRRAGIRFRAMELESLGERPVVRDLMALTCALTHPADRTAWLAVLRAPWCGLELNDLFVLAGDDLRTPVPSLLADDARWARLSAAGKVRLARVRGILRAACTERGRGTLREQVERLWLQLAGPCTLATLEDLEDAEAFLDLLEEFDAGGALTSVETLSKALTELFARPDPQADDGLQLMTIHKAKGLEFDVVIVPGLGFSTGRTQRPLLMYLERTRTVAGPDLLLAPLNARGTDHDPLYELVLALRKDQEAFEQLRLLYVAATRAKQRLHLLGHTTFKEQDGKKIVQPPRKYSLLAALWPAVKDVFEQALT
ncbi:MAG: UvrD-helicase domain-containing protein, partial [Gammaproteobacteria bacterium]